MTMVMAILGVLFVFVVTFVALGVFLALIHRAMGEPADPETTRAAAKISAASGP